MRVGSASTPKGRGPIKPVLRRETAVASSNCLWQGCAAAAQIAIVHRRQIVMNEGVGMKPSRSQRLPCSAQTARATPKKARRPRGPERGRRPFSRGARAE